MALRLHLHHRDHAAVSRARAHRRLASGRARVRCPRLAPPPPAGNLRQHRPFHLAPRPGHPLLFRLGPRPGQGLPFHPAPRLLPPRQSLPHLPLYLRQRRLRRHPPQRQRPPQRRRPPQRHPPHRQRPRERRQRARRCLHRPRHNAHRPRRVDHRHPVPRVRPPPKVRRAPRAVRHPARLGRLPQPGPLGLPRPLAPSVWFRRSHRSRRLISPVRLPLCPRPLRPPSLRRLSALPLRQLLPRPSGPRFPSRLPLPSRPPRRQLRQPRFLRARFSMCPTPHLPPWPCRWRTHQPHLHRPRRRNLRPRAFVAATPAS